MMDYRKEIYFIYLTVILLVKVITGQNVKVGTADFQIGKGAQIDCDFNSGNVNALRWKISTTDIYDVPPGDIIIQYSVINNITIDPDYKGHIQLTKDYNLVFDTVNGTDRELRYWCHVNLDGNSGADYTNVTKIDPVMPGEITDNCVPTSKCKTGNSINCTVSCFNPTSDDFNLKWTIGGEEILGTTTTVTPSGSCFDGISTYTIGANDAIGARTFTCEPEGRAYQYATPGEYSRSKDIEIVKGGGTPEPPPPPPLSIWVIISITAAAAAAAGGIALGVGVFLYKKHKRVATPQEQSTTIAPVCNIQAIVNSDKEVTLLWSKKPGCEDNISSFVVEYQDKDDRSHQWKRDDGADASKRNTMSWTVTNLTRGHIYLFRVKAIDRNDKQSEPEVIKKPVELGSHATGKPDAPGNLTVMKEKPKSVVLQWDAPIIHGGKQVTKYYIYKEDPAMSATPCKESQTLCCEIDGLKSGEKYNFYVTAANDCGESKASEPAYITFGSK